MRQFQRMEDEMGRITTADGAEISRKDRASNADVINKDLLAFQA